MKIRRTSFGVLNWRQWVPFYPPCLSSTSTSALFCIQDKITENKALKSTIFSSETTRETDDEFPILMLSALSYFSQGAASEDAGSGGPRRRGIHHAQSHARTCRVYKRCLVCGGGSDNHSCPSYCAVLARSNRALSSSDPPRCRGTHNPRRRCSMSGCTLSARACSWDSSSSLPSASLSASFPTRARMEVSPHFIFLLLLANLLKVGLPPWNSEDNTYKSGDYGPVNS